ITMNRLRFFILVFFLALLFWGGANISSDLERAFDSVKVSVLNSLNVKKFYSELLERIDLEREREYRIIFVGDIMLSREVGRQIKINSDPRFPFLKIADFLNSGDLVFGNLEGPISERGKNQGSIYSFRADPQTVHGLKFAGFDGLFLANNHIFDWGEIALIDTIDTLKNNGIQTVGAGKEYKSANEPVIFEIGNSTIGFLAYTNLYPEGLKATVESAGVSFFNLGFIEDQIAELERRVDLVVISLHWGEEYENKSNDNQKRIAKELIDSGADVVVGHHPHVIQEVENYNNGWIAYSLGNFVFDQSFSEETMGGMALEVFVKNK